MSGVLIHQFRVGPMANFVYFVGDSDDDQVYVVDPGWEAEKIRQEAMSMGKRITGILCTHSHYDHVNEVESLLTTHDIPVYMLKAEIDYSGFKCENLIPLTSRDKLWIGRMPIEVLHTPGHTQGSCCFRIQNNIVTGDTLFVEGCGRCDFITGNAEDMYKSLFRLSHDLPPQTVIYPGHDYGPTPSDSIGNQLKTNPYLMLQSLNEFILFRSQPKK